MNKTINKVVLNMVTMATISSALCSAVSGDEVKKHYVDWQEVEKLCDTVYEIIKQDDFEPDLIIGLSRGGLIPLGYLANEKMFDIRDTLSIAVRSYDKTKQGSITLRLPVHTEDLQRYKSILIVDDLIDSGKTIAFVMNLLKQDLPDAIIKSAVLFYKPASASVKPDYYAQETTDWIVFPWEAAQ